MVLIPPVTLHSVRLPHIRLNVAEAGPANGQPLFLLHGFPEHWACWVDQIPALASAGFHVIAPNQRGYAGSDKPSGAAAYQLPLLVNDLLALFARYTSGPVLLAGHDWGGIIAWVLAAWFPEKVQRLAILNAPHPALMRTAFRRPRQLLRSAYAGFFQLPSLPEALLRRRGYAALRQALLRTSRPGAFTPALLAEYQSAWSQPGALTSMLNYYRALVRYPPSFSRPAHLPMPVHILWGMRDSALLPELATASLAYCANARLTYFPAATHWLQHEEAPSINETLTAFFRAPAGDWPAAAP